MLKEFLGYHGTNKTDVLKIISTRFEINTKNIGWLGTGIYFFENSSNMAASWGRFDNPDRIINVIECIIKVPEEKVFDVTDPYSEHTRKFHALRIEMIPILAKNNINIKVKNKSDHDGKIYNMICISDGYMIVRTFTYTFQSVDRQFGASSRVPNGIELCLKNNTYITSKRIIEMGD